MKKKRVHKGKKTQPSQIIPSKSIPKPSLFKNKDNKVIHFVWVGGKLPDDKIEKMKEWQKLNPDFRIVVWCDEHSINGYPKDPSAPSLKNGTMTKDGIIYKDYKKALENIPLDPETIKLINQILLNEIYLPGGNYAAVSDIVRLLALFQESGFYFDFDEPAIPLSKYYEILTQAQYGGGDLSNPSSIANNTLAFADKADAIIKKYLMFIIKNYTEEQGTGKPKSPADEIIKRDSLHPLSDIPKRLAYFQKFMGHFKAYLEAEKIVPSPEKANAYCENIINDISENVYSPEFRQFENFLITQMPLLYDRFNAELVNNETGPRVMKQAFEGYPTKLYNACQIIDIPNMGAQHGWWKIPPQQRQNWIYIVNFHRIHPYAIQSNQLRIICESLNENNVPLDFNLISKPFIDAFEKIAEPLKKYVGEKVDLEILLKEVEAVNYNQKKVKNLPILKNVENLKVKHLLKLLKDYKEAKQYLNIHLLEPMKEFKRNNPPSLQIIGEEKYHALLALVSEQPIISEVSNLMIFSGGNQKKQHPPSVDQTIESKSSGDQPSSPGKNNKL